MRVHEIERRIKRLKEAGGAVVSEGGDNRGFWS